MKCRCGRKAAKGKKSCQKCIDQRTARREKLAAQGLCQCGRKAMKGKKCCQKCRDLAAARREKHAAQGLCGCGRKSAKGMKSCQKCLDQVNAKHKKRAAQGLCQCGKKSVKGKRCLVCLKKSTFRKLERFGVTDGKKWLREHPKCEVCGSFERGSVLCIDHDHRTGVLRGRLCGNCNSALGHVKDDPKLARKLAAYLERFSRKRSRAA